MAKIKTGSLRTVVKEREAQDELDLWSDALGRFMLRLGQIEFFTYGVLVRFDLDQEYTQSLTTNFRSLPKRLKRVRKLLGALSSRNSNAATKLLDRLVELNDIRGDLAHSPVIYEAKTGTDGMNFIRLVIRPATNFSRTYELAEVQSLALEAQELAMQCFQLQHDIELAMAGRMSFAND